MCPLVGVIASHARLWINETFHIAPIMWSVLLLDSGANKNGIMSALTLIIQQYEDELDKQRQSGQSKQTRAGQSDQTRAAQDAQEPTGGQRRGRRFGTAKRRRIETANADRDHCRIPCDEGSLPAIGVQMAAHDNRALAMYDEGEVSKL